MLWWILPFVGCDGVDEAGRRIAEAGRPVDAMGADQQIDAHSLDGAMADTARDVTVDAAADATVDSGLDVASPADLSELEDSGPPDAAEGDAAPAPRHLALG